MDLIRSIVRASDVCDWLRRCLKRYRRFGAPHDLPDISFYVLVGPNTAKYFVAPGKRFASKFEAAIVFKMVFCSLPRPVMHQFKNVALSGIPEDHSKDNVIPRIRATVVPQTDAKTSSLFPRGEDNRPTSSAQRLLSNVRLQSTPYIWWTLQPLGTSQSDGRIVHKSYTLQAR